MILRAPQSPQRYSTPLRKGMPEEAPEDEPGAGVALPGAIPGLLMMTKLTTTDVCRLCGRWMDEWIDAMIQMLRSATQLSTFSSRFGGQTSHHVLVAVVVVEASWVGRLKTFFNEFNKQRLYAASQTGFDSTMVSPCRRSDAFISNGRQDKRRQHIGR
jgi:hypothetical protein